MKSTFPLAAAAALVVGAACAPAASADVLIGAFAGGTAEAGWGQFDGDPNYLTTPPNGTDVFTVTDLDTSGDGGALETNRAGFADSFAYSFTIAGTEDAFFANDYLVFDLIYRGEATDDTQGGFSQVFQVLFQSDFNSFALQSFQQDAEGDSLSAFGDGTSAGFGPGDAAAPVTVLNVAIDYRPFKETLPEGFDPQTLQFWFSTNDDNRPFKAIDNVRLVAVPEPATVGLAAFGGLLLAARRRR